MESAPAVGEAVPLSAAADVAASSPQQASSPAAGRAKSKARGATAKTSPFRGVVATGDATSAWRARIRYGRYTIHLGRCASPRRR